MAGYWVMRTDRDASEFVWSELRQGRLRQGWGYDPAQNLEVILEMVRRGDKLSDAQARSWRGSRRLLDSEPDGIRIGDVIVTPHLPHYGEWSIARVTRPYRFDIPATHGDYGHIVPVELLTARRPVNPYERAVSAKLRQTMRCQLRLWNIDTLGPEVEQIARAIQAGEPGDSVAERLPEVLCSLEVAVWEALQYHYHGAEFEEPCLMLLKSLYGEANVEHTGGSSERGADAICRYTDPVGVQHCAAVQIKMWEWDAAWTRPLDQIKQACLAYEGITAGVIISTSKRTTPEFDNACTLLRSELGIPIRVILRQELLRKVIGALPQSLVQTEQG